MDKYLLKIITELTKFNNQYRSLSKKSLTGYLILKIMWDAGDILKRYIEKMGLNPHELFWKIYGREKSLQNSYITRDWCSYCYRIRTFFKSQKEIDKNLHGSYDYKTFREALPLLANEKYRGNLSEKQLKSIYSLILDKKVPESRKKRKFGDMKKGVINIKNTRQQRKKDFEKEKELFSRLFKEILNRINEKELEKMRSEHKDFFSELSRLFFSLSDEGYNRQNINFSDLSFPSGEWKDLVESLMAIKESKNIDSRLRLRKWAIAPTKLLNFSELLDYIVRGESATNIHKKFLNEK